MSKKRALLAALGDLGSVVAGYQIARSLRFNSADSTYLNRTPAGAPTSRRIGTWSGWFKRSKPSTEQALWSASDVVQTRLYFSAGDQLAFTQAANVYTFTPLYRDPSAWLHIVFGYDTTQATAGNRLTLEVNGISVAATGTVPAQNTDMDFGHTVVQQIGRYWSGSPLYFDGYTAEQHYIDGQKLAASTFGETSAATGAWTPKAYAGTYGANGFRLDFSDNSGITSATLGKDRSGNNNDWTPNNFSVTAGVGNDSLTDTPTNYGTDTGLGGEVRGSYGTWNPLDIGGAGAVSNGALDLSQPLSTHSRGNFGMSAGKWYFEVSFNSGPGPMIGVANSSASKANFPGGDANGWAYYINGSKYNGAGGVAYGTAYVIADVIGVAVDKDNEKIFFRKNATWQAGGDPVAGTNAAFTNLAGHTVFAAVGEGNGPGSSGFSLNTGQRPFANPAPSGYKALCTQNLTASVVPRSDDRFGASLRTGTGAAYSVTGKRFGTDMMALIKARSAATDWAMFDSVRGVQKMKGTPTTAVETTEAQGVTAFGAAGYSGGTLARINGSGVTLLDLLFHLSTIAGMAAVNYTGTGANRTIAHTLGVPPELKIIIPRTAVQSIPVYHKAVALTQALMLDTSAAAATLSAWNGTAPTSSVFSLGVGITNTNLIDYTAFLAASVPGFSKIGSYTGNGSADGPYIHCGFRPRLAVIRRTDAVAQWVWLDAARNPYNPIDRYVYTSDAGVEPATYTWLDFTAGGFKIRTTDQYVNTSASPYTFWAIGDDFKTARAA